LGKTFRHLDRFLKSYFQWPEGLQLFEKVNERIAATQSQEFIVPGLDLACPLKLFTKCNIKVRREKCNCCWNIEVTKDFPLLQK
jgi:hypothetical protein